MKMKNKKFKYPVIVYVLPYDVDTRAVLEVAEHFPDDDCEKNRIKDVESGRAIPFKTIKEARKFCEAYDEIICTADELKMELEELIKKAGAK